MTFEFSYKESRFTEFYQANCFFDLTVKIWTEKDMQGLKMVSFVILRTLILLIKNEIMSISVEILKVR